MNASLANVARCSTALVLLSACAQERGVTIESFEIEPKTIEVGEQFQVAWKSHRHRGAGDIYWYGVYFAEDAELEALGQLFANDGTVPKLFARGDLAGDPGHIRCTRDTATSVRCTPFGSFTGMTLPGRHTVTLRACLSYVLSDIDTCDSMEAVVDFP